jgi:Protein of unknown function (DUF3489)
MYERHRAPASHFSRKSVGEHSKQTERGNSILTPSGMTSACRRQTGSSVRGCLAGTVKKKLSFALTSLKRDDGFRRYHIKNRRSR